MTDKYDVPGAIKMLPLGVMPRRLWDEHRMTHLLHAAVRYNKAGIEIPPEWREEYNELVLLWYG